MGVWIRTQDKQSLFLIDNLGTATTVDGSTLITNILDKTQPKSQYVLGEYPTEERALEVINAIQDHIQKGNKGVYTMPEGGADG